MLKPWHWICYFTAWLILVFGYPVIQALAQAPPYGHGTVMSKTTIAVTNTYISIAPKNGGRVGCLLQNVGTNKMFLFLDQTGGNTPPADTTTSFQIAAGASFSCTLGDGTVVTDELWLTGTSADVAVLGLQ